MKDLQIYCNEIEAQLKEWDAKLDRLKMKAKLAEGDIQIEMSDEIHLLKTKKKAVDAKLNELRDATGDACLMIKEDLTEALKDLETSFQNTTSKFK